MTTNDTTTKNTTRQGKLRLKRETLGALTADEARLIVGGARSGGYTQEYTCWTWACNNHNETVLLPAAARRAAVAVLALAVGGVAFGFGTSPGTGPRREAAAISASPSTPPARAIVYNHNEIVLRPTRG